MFTQIITRVIRIHSLRIINNLSKFHDNLFESLWDDDPVDHRVWRVIKLIEIQSWRPANKGHAFLLWVWDPSITSPSHSRRRHHWCPSSSILHQHHSFITSCSHWIKRFILWQINCVCAALIVGQATVWWMCLPQQRPHRHKRKHTETQQTNK